MMISHRTRRATGRFALCALLALGVGACDDDGTSLEGETALRVLLTDAPSDYIAAAEVDIGAVELLGGSEGPLLLSEDGTNGMVNLLELQNEATMILADTDVQADTYTQLRLVVEEASVTLADGYEFNDLTTTRSLTVPSGAETGIKLNLSAGDGDESSGGLQLAPGEMVLVLDFDVNQSFVLQGNPETPAGLNGVIFTPTLRVVVDDVAGSISGSVITDVAGLVLEGMVVRAEPTDGTTLEPFQSETATALVDDEGNYTIRYLVPGEYTVSIDAGAGFVGELVEGGTEVVVTVGESEAVLDIDFRILES